MPPMLYLAGALIGNFNNIPISMMQYLTGIYKIIQSQSYILSYTQRACGLVIIN